MIIDGKIYGHLTTDTNKLRVNVTGVGEFTMEALMLLSQEYLALSAFEYIKENEHFPDKTDEELLDIAREVRSYMENDGYSEEEAIKEVANDINKENEEDQDRWASQATECIFYLN